MSDALLFDMQNCYDKFQKGGIDMASIVKRNKSFGVVYTSYEGGKQKQHWEPYHSYEAALHRKEQVELIQKSGRRGYKAVLII